MVFEVDVFLICWLLQWANLDKHDAQSFWSWTCKGVKTAGPETKLPLIVFLALVWKFNKEEEDNDDDVVVVEVVGDKRSELEFNKAVKTW